jgi:hypothetical protein
MSLYGPVEILIVAMLSPFRHLRVTLPCGLITTALLLTICFWTDDSSIYGVPIDVATIGMRLPNVVLDEQGWTGLGIWTATAAIFGTSLAVWTVLLPKERNQSRAGQRSVPPVRRIALFIGANFLMPTIFVPVILTVLLSDLEILFLMNNEVFPGGEEADLVLLNDLSGRDLALAILLGLPASWLFLRLAIWPTIVLAAGWRQSLQKAWRAGRGLVGRFLCYFLATAFITRRIFDLATFGLYELEWQLRDIAAFDNVMLLSISSIGVICTVLLGFWVSAVMALHLPDDIVEVENSVVDLF